jgi:hypothetical protein
MQYNTILPPEYKSVYVDHKLDIIAQNARDRYDKNLEAKNQLDRTIGAMRVNPLDQPIVDAAKQNVEDLIGSANSFELIGPAVDAALTGTVSNKLLTDSLISYQRAEEDEVRKKVLRETNKAYAFGETPAVDNTGKILRNEDGSIIMKSDRATHSTLRDGIFVGKTEEKGDLDGTISTAMQGIAQESLEQGSGVVYEALLAAGVKRNQNGQWLMTKTGVDATKIKAVRDALTDVIADTPNGKQFIRAMTQIVPLEGADRLHTEKEARDLITAKAAAYGLKQQGVMAQIFGAYNPPRSTAVKAETLPVEETILEIPEVINVQKEKVESFSGALENVFEEDGKYKGDSYFGVFTGVNKKANITEFRSKLAESKAFNFMDRDYLESDAGADGFAQAVLEGDFGKNLRVPGETEAQLVNKVSKALHVMAPVREKKVKKEAAYALITENLSDIQFVVNGKEYSYDEYLTEVLSSPTKTDTGMKEDFLLALSTAEYTFPITGNNAGLIKVKWLNQAGLDEIETSYIKPVANSDIYDAYAPIRATYAFHDSGKLDSGQIIQTDRTILEKMLGKDELGNQIVLPQGARLIEKNEFKKTVDKNGKPGLELITYRVVVDSKLRPISNRSYPLNDALRDAELPIKEAIRRGSNLGQLFTNFSQTNQLEVPNIPKDTSE